MERKVPLPRSQVSGHNWATWTQSNILISLLFVYFNIILQARPKCLRWPPLQITTKILCVFFVSHFYDENCSLKSVRCQVENMQGTSEAGEYATECK
jgi:hypothetical protein